MGRRSRITLHTWEIFSGIAPGCHLAVRLSLAMQERTFSLQVGAYIALGQSVRLSGRLNSGRSGR
jgi:hypothetical protein